MRQLWERFSTERELNQREARPGGNRTRRPLLARVWER
jgi:hypothetical protein